MKILTKLKDFVGLNEPEDYDYFEEEGTAPAQETFPNLFEEVSPPAAEPTPTPRRRIREETPPMMDANFNSARSNVIGMPGVAHGATEVVVIEPHSFEEMPQVIQTLRERRSVVLNLNVMDPEEAQRAVDFVAGGTYAIDGHQERIGESIFLFTPNCVKVSTLSGVVHDVTDATATPITTSSSEPTPVWAAEASRIAQ